LELWNRTDVTVIMLVYIIVISNLQFHEDQSKHFTLHTNLDVRLPTI